MSATGADEARDAMQWAVSQLPFVTDAGSAYVAARKTFLAATDVEDAASKLLELTIAAERLAEAAADVEKNARLALATYMEEVGAPDVTTMHHRASMAKKSSFASEDQPDLTPQDCMTKPAPDRKLILEKLKRGEDVPGWSLRIPNAMSLRITARK